MKIKLIMIPVLLVFGFVFAACSMGGGSTEGATTPPPPDGLTVTNTAPTTIELTWSTVSGAAKYKIYRAPTSTGDYSYVDETVYNKYTVSDLSAGNTYYFKVSAVNSNGLEGPQSNYKDGTTSSIMPPVGLNAVGTASNTISLTWTAVSGAAKYKIYISIASAGVYSHHDETEYNSYIVSNLSAGHPYYFKVSAVDSNGLESELSTYAGTETLEQVIPVPANVNAYTVSFDRIQINWNSVSGVIIGYKVYRSSDNSSGPYTLITSNSITGTTYTDTELRPLSTYYYRVSVVASQGEGEQSSAVSAMTPAEDAIQPPTGLSASAQGSNSIYVSWNNVTAAVSYRIYRSNSSSGSYSFIGTSTSTSYTDSGLNANTIYYYKVSSVSNSQEESVQTSNHASATTQNDDTSQAGDSWSVTNVAEWNTAVNGIRSGGNNKSYTISVNGNISLPVSTGNMFGSSLNITVTLEGSGSLALSASGTLLQMGIGQTVIVRNLTLRGRSDNDSPLVRISNGGIFRMEGSAAVSDNTNSGYSYYGGGVYVDGGTFIMQGNAAVSGNTTGGWYGGGGVYVNSGTFIMQGNAAVSGNTAGGWYGGGGVYVASNGRFTMEGGTVSGNTASGSSGGGVYIYGGNFTMEGGTVSYNTANNGGGAYVDNSGSFIMEGGTIPSNIATNGNGGGVNVNSGSFTKTGGTIFGNGADTTLRNTASSQGNAAYANSYPVQWRNATAGPNDRTGDYGFWLNEAN